MVRRVLLVYESLGTPSTTVRALQFRDCFEHDPDLDARFISRSSEPMNKVMARWPWRPSVRRPAMAVQSAIETRRENAIVRLARQADIVMMMTVPSWALHQRLSELDNTLLVTDLIDALWLPAFQRQGWQHIDEMLQSSDCVICENEFTAQYTRRHNSNVVVIPDSPQVEAFDQLRDSVGRPEDECRLGWIGGKYTADALYQIFEVLEGLFEDHAQLHLRLVGVDPDRLPRFEKVRYSVRTTYDQEAMIREALAMHIGLFPMFDVDESRYRGSLKTRIYMAAGAAVIGQRLGENETLIRDGTNGLLAADNRQWDQAIRRLVDDPGLRTRIAQEGLRTIRDQFTRERCYRRLRDVLLAL